MNTQVSVLELLHAFPDAYWAIDIRTAAVLEESRWTNVLTILRLTSELPEPLTQRHEQLTRAHGSVDLDHFAIRLKALPISDWSTVTTQCAGGHLQVGNLDVHLSAKYEISNRPSYIRRQHSIVRPVGRPWPSYESCEGSFYAQKLLTPVVSRELGSSGWSNAEEAMNPLMEVDIGQGGWMFI